MSNIRNGWVIRLDPEGSEQEDDQRTWWTGSAFSGSLHDAIFFASEMDAFKVSKTLADPTAIDFLHDPRPASAKDTGSQVGGKS
jgi:hypothetical protein